MRALVIAGVIAVAGSANADGIGVIAAASHRGEVAAALGDVLREAGTARVIKDAVGDARLAASEGAVPVATLAQFKHVREMIDEGWRAYTQVQLDFAASRLAAARTAAEELLALPGASIVYADASLRLGAVLAQLGRGAESRAAIALALALDPDRPITELEFSPDVIAAVAAARGQAPLVRAATIATDPAGATLTVDGRDVGRSPVTIELAPGEHVAIARAPGYRPRGQAVAITATTARPERAVPERAVPERIDMQLERDERAAQLAAGATLGMPDAAAGELVDGVLELADLDEIVLAAQTDRSGGPTLLVQRCAGAPARCTAVVEIGYADASGVFAAARSAWSSLRTAELRYAPTVFGDPRVIEPRVVVHHCDVCRNPYLWGGVGALIVAGAITAIVIATESKPNPIVDVGSGFTH
ncbi:MAG TPA: PEGA domain-containing protein [Kofleriaceae bacterium]|nr:PEGA domain-containing protein [Kofleriaceae bacterium]